MTERNTAPYEDILDLVGWTPLVRLKRVTEGIRTPLYGKCEFMNPGGSVKDRIGRAIVEDAERTGKLRPGGTIVEATSGNTGLALAPSMTNLLMARVGASTGIPVNPRRPDDLRIGADFFVFGKANTNGPISAPSTANRFVGWECDLRVDWRITSDVSFNFRYGLFIPNGGNPGPIDQVRQFVYGGISYAF